MDNEKFNLTCEEAIRACLNGEGFIRGENFGKGIYVTESAGVLILVQKKEKGFYTNLGNFMITKGTVTQKYRLFTVANDKEFFE